ncbi:actin binding protein [Cavenderia fasciculata]|uniref:Actin binding protein n=1 Tax=Cavenderia fasciculata TaxID=261658 RepID=F4Q6M0_CACFS|nr:actin binding protein [Cavenderia fasciculata]EGG16530.1 actin binding protein [Cavenderia fasciculata]|eukprot:XP_004354930.1 actin binding protein [Cavenderia fasciculata]
MDPPQPPNSTSTSTSTSSTLNTSNGLSNSKSSEDIFTQGKRGPTYPTFTIKASNTTPNGSINNSPTLSPTQSGQVGSPNSVSTSLSFSSSTSSSQSPSLTSSTTSTATASSLAAAQQTPEIRVRNHHDFKPYRSSSPCVFCGEQMNKIWNPFTSHSYKCSCCGIVCHKKCLDLMNTISCSNNKLHKKTSTLTVSQQNQNNLSSSSNTIGSNSDPLSLSRSSSAAELNLQPNQGNTIAVPTSSLAMPNQMPDEKVIDSMFESLAKERELSFPSNFKWTKETKWLLLVQHGKLRKEGASASGSTSGGEDHSAPEYFIKSLQSNATQELFLSLHVNLRTKTIAWLAKFIEMEGIALIFALLNNKKKEYREECVRSIAIIMNSPLGLKAVTSEPVSAKRFAMVLVTPQFSLKARAIVIELLTVMCMEKWVPGGYSMVLKALTNLKEKKRFTTFVKFIKENNSLEMKTKALCFINVLIHEPEETSVRVNIRSEFLRLGLYDYLKILKATLSQEDSLLIQIEIFEEMMEEDNQEMEQKLEDLKRQLGIDIDNLDAVFKAIKQTASKSGLTKSLLSIMQNLLVIKNDQDGIKYWLLCDSLIKQVSLHRSGLGDNMDFKGMLANVDNATKEVTLTRKLEELEKQNIDKAAIIQEKDINIKALLDIVKQIKAGGGEVSPQLAKQIESIMKTLEPAKPDKNDKTIPEVEEPVTTLIPPPPTSVVEEPATESTGGPPPPPPPPMMGGPGGPPPPPPPPMPGKKGPALIKTRPPPVVPKPAHPLKALQWVKMQPAKCNDSVFNVLGEMKDINLPWKEIESEFAAKIIVREKKVNKPRGPANVVDGKLAQNISIFLSQFKGYSNKQLLDTIQNMDDKMMNRDQVRQVSKLLPSKDDMAALKEFLSAEERSKLATPDQFCIDMGAFAYANEKIQLFMLKGEFYQRMQEMRPQVAAVSLACDEILKSKRLQRLFEIILVLGNFINFGTVRGEQPAYKIDCLIKLADTKSSDLQSNLVHTLVKYCTNSEKQLLTFADELQSLSVAKRIIWSGVVADAAALTRDYNACKEIVENFQKQNIPFHETMVSFLQVAGTEMEKLKKLQLATEENYKKLCTYVGEEPGKVTPDELFELFARFIEIFETASQFLAELKEREEKEAKREAQKQLRDELKKTLNSKPQNNQNNQNNNSSNNSTGKNDQEDDIVNDLLLAVRDGDVFRKGRRKQNSTGGSPIPSNDREEVSKKLSQILTNNLNQQQQQNH